MSTLQDDLREIAEVLETDSHYSGSDESKRRMGHATTLREHAAAMDAASPVAQASMEFGEALDELIRANTAADADDRFGVERERRARANVERLYSLAAAPSAPFTPEAAALRSIVEGKGS